MIFILCPSYLDALDAFDVFVDYMEHNEPWELKTVHSYANMVITDDDLRYVFIYKGYAPIFDDGKADLIDMDQFFNDIIDLYYYGR